MSEDHGTREAERYGHHHHHDHGDGSEVRRRHRHRRRRRRHGHYDLLFKLLFGGGNQIGGDLGGWF